MDRHGKTEIGRHSIGDVRPVLPTIVTAIQAPVILQEHPLGLPRRLRDLTDLGAPLLRDSDGELGVNPSIEKTGGQRGWIGDSPLIHLDCSKIRALDWRPQMGIKEGISATVRWLSDNPYVIQGDEKS